MTMIQYQAFIHAFKDQQKEIMNQLFEPSTGLIELTICNDEFLSSARKLNNYKDFIELIRSALIRICIDAENKSILPSNDKKLSQLKDVVNAHPRLCGPKSRISKHSLFEQRNLQNNQDPPEVQKKVLELNERYEKIYPGLRFVVFVNGRSRTEIIKVMRSRIDSGNSWFQEMYTALQELCNIAQDRYYKHSGDSHL